MSCCAGASKPSLTANPQLRPVLLESEPMKRPTFHIACLLSAILCTGSLFLWFRSYRTADYLAYCAEKNEYGAISTVGTILIYDESAIDPFRWNTPLGWQRAARPAPDSIAAYAMPQG